MIRKKKRKKNQKKVAISFFCIKFTPEINQKYMLEINTKSKKTIY